MTDSITPYDPRYKQAFYDLNIYWLEKFFTVEPEHVALLSDPEAAILKDGGEVFFALENGRAVGTVAMKSYGNGVFELTKLGVDPGAQGGGYGRKLCERVIESFNEKGGTKLFLETHTKLEAAMALYEKLGFTLAKNPLGDIYEGTDCYMEWRRENIAADIKSIEICPAKSVADQAAVKDIFQDFIDFLPIDLGFQDIAVEMANFPEGFEILLLAKQGGKPIGAVGLKAHDADVCEMKRLFVREEAQGTGAGRILCEQLIEDARALGYKTMLLDSLKRLEAAVALYRKLGFEEIKPYNFNPEADVIYMKIAL